MKTELNIMSEAWQNFCREVWHGSTLDLTVDSVNRELEQYNAYCRDLGEWRVYFNDEPSLTYFLLRWS